MGAATTDNRPRCRRRVHQGGGHHEIQAIFIAGARLARSAPRIGNKSKETGTPPSASQAQRCRPHHGSTQGATSRSRRASRTSTGGRCLGARGKQAQLAQANGSKFNLFLMLVAQMSTYPRAIATHYCSWGSRKFELTHSALTAFEEVEVQLTASRSRARRIIDAAMRRVST